MKIILGFSAVMLGIFMVVLGLIFPNTSMVIAAFLAVLAGILMMFSDDNFRRQVFARYHEDFERDRNRRR